jgi:hypothetical protein
VLVARGALEVRQTVRDHRAQVRHLRQRFLDRVHQPELSGAWQAPVGAGRNDLVEHMRQDATLIG